MMNFKDIGRELLKASRKRDDGLVVAYQKRFREIHEIVNRFDGLKSRLMVKDNLDALDLIRFSAFANDLTRLSLAPGGEMKVRITDPFQLAGGGPLKLTFRNDRNHQLNVIDGKVQASPAFLLRSDSFAKKTINTIAPLMMHGKVIVEPARAILVPRLFRNAGENASWELIGVDEDSPFNE